MSFRLPIIVICLLTTQIATAQEEDDHFRINPNQNWGVEPDKTRSVQPNTDYGIKPGDDRNIRPATNYGVDPNNARSTQPHEARRSKDPDRTLPTSTRDREREAGVRHTETSNKREGNTADTATQTARATGWIEFEPKIEKQLGKRGWTKESIKDTIQNPSRTVDTRDIRHLPDGTKLNDPATAYINSDGSYVVRNSMTMQIVQVSDRNNPNWKSPFD